jgi:hypothetical protein
MTEQSFGLYMKAIHGRKTKSDAIDSEKIARLEMRLISFGWLTAHCRPMAFCFSLLLAAVFVPVLRAQIPVEVEIETVYELETDDPDWRLAVDLSTGESALVSTDEFIWESDGLTHDLYFAHYVDELGNESWLLYDGALDTYTGPAGTMNALMAPNPVKIIIEIIKKVITKTPKKTPPKKLPPKNLPGKKPPLKPGEKVVGEHELPDGTIIRKISTPPDGKIRVEEIKPIRVGTGDPEPPNALPADLDAP